MSSSTVLLKPEELPDIFQIMIEKPQCRNHMLFLGPPGCSKTTTAISFATAIHGKVTNRFASLLFLNSSDERSLETMRQKVYPFVESRMQNFFFSEEEAPPKVIIFDEAETLTDQAQCALRPLLQRSTKEVILIFICNSLSHIHPQILNKFIIIPFTPTSTTLLHKIVGSKIPVLDSLYRRGDIRFFKQCPQDRKQVTKFLFQFLHASTKEEVFSIATASGCPLRERISWFLLFTQDICPLTTDELNVWSSLTATETQAYLDEPMQKELLWRLWLTRVQKIAMGGGLNLHGT